MSQLERVAVSRQCKTQSKKMSALCETLESRMLLSVTASHGYTVNTFANAPAGATQPDSIAVDGTNVYIGYQNGAAKDGSDGKTSTIVQYNATGGVVHSFSVPGHNDGIKVDPATHLVWAMQNEDGNPNLVIIDPAAVTQTQETFAAPPANGGGYDDITFAAGKTYFSKSAPASNPNTAPAIVQATLSGTTVTVTPVHPPFPRHMDSRRARPRGYRRLGGRRRVVLMISSTAFIQVSCPPKRRQKDR